MYRNFAKTFLNKFSIKLQKQTNIEIYAKWKKETFKLLILLVMLILILSRPVKGKEYIGDFHFDFNFRFIDTIL